MSVHAARVLLGALLATGCGDATSPAVEGLSERGPRDASIDQALSFDGVDDYASVGTARFPQIERAQTLSLWALPAEAAPSAETLQVLFTLRRSDYSGIVLALERSVPIAYNVWGPRDLTRAEAPLALGKWQHLAFVLDAVGSHLYVDGAEVATGPLPNTNRTPVVSFIGSLDGYAHLFHGQVDELRCYDRAFSAEEVAALARGELADAEPLVLSLPFDEIGGARSYDRSGLGNHAELGDGVASAMPARVPSDRR